MKNNITIYDIAREAKVSPATVSRVLTGSARVSVEKSRIIREIIEKYDFQPNAIARSLVKKESRTIGVILPDIVNPFFATVFLEAEKYAVSLGYSMLLCNSINDMFESNIALESIYLKTLTEKQVDGIIFLGGRINMVRTDKKLAEEMNTVLAKVPIVMINGRMGGVDCYKVRSDEREGIFSIVEYLTSLGHRSIGFIGGRLNVTSTAIKLNALKDALRHFKLEFNEKWIVISGDFNIENGAKAMKTLLSEKERPTAVIAVNDTVAIGAMKYAASVGVDIPGDISITGFDDSYLCDIVTPRLTSVSHNIPELARKAVDMLCYTFANRSVPKERIVRTSLTIRESCACPRNI
ncbi:hypothetical protein CDQ84_14415 [Clostridium thermosuccinogenes]|jgi:DNA-binding LacI/PurR family transcriptional regulator|uniref:Uncharacterized protein n=1 Tax=Clostridium thermosuccinogenes TaxID=84032 RepID=A0A2K2F9X8_9CLOT|nr:LacI family DNA-binding transcriptional regulator [Pseudoclostridium thermosuccinogenes]AUS96425.1 hypothetical protein CDO33_08285 [Pseudoclostridium thermosuccinogenes]PNT92908.1 hypothetical protein CDQ83_04945 [Pseudoclostridium thermosuccinogenes]PNT95602.1 hypothetical protein CDQ85_14280 [Pseudoclostridium thermosuccinogenes]PNT96798.1 hypothetical protein CDQ84_14415 [Pseudoclostridium thermosuccinogenes]